MSRLRRRRVLLRSRDVPGGLKDWTAVLPESHRGNPHVIVVMAKRGAVTRIGFYRNHPVGLIETKRGPRGLQVVGGGGNYVDHSTLIEEHYGVPMADPAYIGPLLNIPNSVLLNDLVPLVFLRDRMGEPYLNLKQHLWNITKVGDGTKFN